MYIFLVKNIVRSIIKDAKSELTLIRTVVLRKNTWNPGKNLARGKGTTTYFRV